MTNLTIYLFLTKRFVVLTGCIGSALYLGTWFFLVFGAQNYVIKTIFVQKYFVYWLGGIFFSPKISCILYFMRRSSFWAWFPCVS